MMMRLFEFLPIEAPSNRLNSAKPRYGFEAMACCQLAVRLIATARHSACPLSKDLPKDDWKLPRKLFSLPVSMKPAVDRWLALLSQPQFILKPAHIPMLHDPKKLQRTNARFC